MKDLYFISVLIISMSIGSMNTPALGWLMLGVFGLIACFVKLIGRVKL